MSTPAWVECIRQGDASKLRMLEFENEELYGEEDYYYKTGFLYTPLGWAVEQGHVEIVKVLLKEKCANPEGFFGPGQGFGFFWTPLGYSIEKEHVDIAALLLQYGAKTSTTFHARQQRDLWTPLGYAIYKDSASFVSLLASRGAAVCSLFRAFGKDYLPLEFAEEYEKDARHVLEQLCSAESTSSGGFSGESMGEASSHPHQTADDLVAPAQHSGIEMSFEFASEVLVADSSLEKSPSGHIPVSSRRQVAYGREAAIYHVETLLRQPDVSILGEGGFGRVYLAHLLDGTPVAIKVVVPEASVDEQLGLMDEVNLMAGLRHPNVIRMLGVGLEPTAMIMELADHGLLATLLRRFPPSSSKELPRHLRLDFCQQVCSGVHYLHRLGIIHRDLKASNVLVMAGIQLKLCDFGLAWMQGDGPKRVAGTATHMAPECFKGAFSPSSDIYAFAVTCWEIWTSQQPLKDHGSPDAVMRLLKQGILVRPDLKAVGNLDVRNLIQVCLSQEPESRPAIDAVMQRLKPLCEAYPVQRRQVFRLEAALRQAAGGQQAECLACDRVQTITFGAPPLSVSPPTVCPSRSHSLF